MEALTDFIDQIVKLTGVPPLVFLVISAVATFLMMAVRRAMKKLEGADWFSLALIGISLVANELLAFLAWKAEFYSCANIYVVVWVGLGNWLLASKGWQIGKQAPKLWRLAGKLLMEGVGYKKDRATEPAKPADDRPDEPEVEVEPEPEDDEKTQPAIKPLPKPGKKIGS